MMTVVSSFAFDDDIVMMRLRLCLLFYSLVVMMFA